jgi:hypothetical protein
MLSPFAEPLRMSAGRTSAWHVGLSIAIVAALAGCAVSEAPRVPDSPILTAAEARALVARKLPANLADRPGWAADIYAAMAAMQIGPSAQNICAVVAVTEQESGFRVDPPVANLSRIAWKEIERHRDSAGIPKLVLLGALSLPSSDGRSYSERIDGVTTEMQLSLIYDDFIGRVPLAKRFLEDRNPVRTAGPMQVSVAFAKAHMEAKPYPYPMQGSVRDEVFTRRGGMYFGIAHLLDYPASYDGLVFRFADFNAGHYASRNAAFQKAVASLSGIELDLDGDLVRYDKGQPAKEPGSTELATRVLAHRLDMSESRIRGDLERGKLPEFERSPLYARVFALADEAARQRVPRAVVPRIALHSAKITRPLTTEWFARRVTERYRSCLGR